MPTAAEANPTVAAPLQALNTPPIGDIPLGAVLRELNLSTATPATEVTRVSANHRRVKRL